MNQGRGTPLQRANLQYRRRFIRKSEVSKGIRTPRAIYLELSQIASQLDSPVLSLWSAERVFLLSEGAAWAAGWERTACTEHAHQTSVPSVWRFHPGASWGCISCATGGGSAAGAPLSAISGGAKETPPVPGCAYQTRGPLENRFQPVSAPGAAAAAPSRATIPLAPSASTGKNDTCARLAFAYHTRPRSSCRNHPDASATGAEGALSGLPSMVVASASAASASAPPPARLFARDLQRGAWGKRDAWGDSTGREGGRVCGGKCSGRVGGF